MSSSLESEGKKMLLSVDWSNGSVHDWLASFLMSVCRRSFPCRRMGAGVEFVVTSKSSQIPVLSPISGQLCGKIDLVDSFSLLALADLLSARY
jgi:hypothetical protein